MQNWAVPIDQPRQELKLEQGRRRRNFAASSARVLHLFLIEDSSTGIMPHERKLEQSESF